MTSKGSVALAQMATLGARRSAGYRRPASGQRVWRDALPNYEGDL